MGDSALSTPLMFFCTLRCVITEVQKKRNVVYFLDSIIMKQHTEVEESTLYVRSISELVVFNLQVIYSKCDV